MINNYAINNSRTDNGTVVLADNVLHKSSKIIVGQYAFQFIMLE